MRKVYFDNPSNRCISVYMKDAEVCPAGTSIYSMSVSDKNEEYQRYAEEYDIHFIFEDHVPEINFYTVPQVDIFAVDSDGGFIGTVGKTTDLESGAEICYIDSNKNCYLIAESGKAFLETVSSWKRCMQLSGDIKIYDSQMEAEQELEFIKLDDLETVLDEADRAVVEDDRRFTHEEVFSNLRKW